MAAATRLTSIPRAHKLETTPTGVVLRKWRHKTASVIQESSGKRYFCGHCSDLLSKTLYYQHRRDYYDSQFRTWSKTSKVPYLPFNRNDADVAMLPPPRDDNSILQGLSTFAYWYNGTSINEHSVTICNQCLKF